MSPTQRSMKYFRDQGLVCGIVERWIPNPRHPAGGFRKDFLGIIDMIFLGLDGVVGVQSCGTDFQPHLRKILDEHLEDLKTWLETPGTKFVLIGWRPVVRKNQDGSVSKVGGGKIYKPRIQEFTFQELETL